MSLNHDIYGRPVQPMNQQSLQMEKKNQIKDLESYYKINVLNNQFLQSVKADLIIITNFQKNGRPIPLDIYVDDSFPFTSPKIIVKTKIIHEKVDPKTLELIYEKDFPWNYQKKTTLKDLLTAMDRILSKNPPIFDPMSEKYKGFTEELEVRKQQFYELDGKKLFPNKKDEEFSTMINYGKQIWTQEILKSDKYSNLLLCSLQLFEQNKQALKELNEKKSEFERRKSKILEIAKELEDKKQELINKYNAATLIKERFNKTKILAALEQEIVKSDDLLYSNIKDQNPKSFEEKCNSYFENRRKYHTFVILKERWEKNM